MTPDAARFDQTPDWFQFPDCESCAGSLQGAAHYCPTCYGHLQARVRALEGDLAFYEGTKHQALRVALDRMLSHDMTHREDGPGRGPCFYFREEIRESIAAPAGAVKAVSPEVPKTDYRARDAAVKPVGVCCMCGEKKELCSCHSCVESVNKPDREPDNSGALMEQMNAERAPACPGPNCRKCEEFGRHCPRCPSRIDA